MEEEDIDDINSIEKLKDYDIVHKYLFRICLLGDAGVGKTSILTRFCDNTFKESYNNTIGVDFRLVTLKYKDIISKLHIWDTAGQERFRSLTLNYLHNSHGFLFIFDITNKDSFDNIVNWINLSFDNNKNSVINFLIGNKCDQNSSRKVEESEAQQFAKEKDLIYLETSAKSDENIQKLFYYCVYKLIKYYDKNDYSEEDNTQLYSNHTEEIKIRRPNQNKCGC
jgi:Ras-related protein Rab-1A